MYFKSLVHTSTCFYYYLFTTQFIIIIVIQRRSRKIIITITVKARETQSHIYIYTKVTKLHVC